MKPQSVRIRELEIENEVLKIRNDWLTEKNETLVESSKICIELMHKTLAIYTQGHVEIQAELNAERAMKL